MSALYRYFFTVRHPYRRPEQAARAAQLVPLVGTIALLALVYGVYVLLSAAGVAGNAHPPIQAGLAVLLLIAWPVLALRLVQRGYVNASAALTGALLGVLSVASLVVDGLQPSVLALLTIGLVYMGMIYGSRGILLATALIWIALPGAASLQRAGQPDVSLREALVSAGLFSLSGLLLWLFAWHLERTAARLTHVASQTRATAAIGQTLARILSLDELLTTAADLIRDRFAFYHVQVFLVDDARLYANLAASTGEIGQALLAQGFRAPVGPRSVVGDTLASGDGHYIPDITETTYQHPELLADARSELALPLMAGSDVLGVLDIHSTRVDAFSPEDVEAMRVIAGQLAQAIQNARLFESQQRSLLQNRRLFLESETNLREIERLNRQLTGQAWQAYLLEHGAEQFSVQLSGDTLQPGGAVWTPAMQQAVAQQEPIAHEADGEQVHAVPITIRGQTVGAIEVRLPAHLDPGEAQTMLQAVTDRLAFSLENARLFEQARLAADREQQINQIAARLQGLNSVDDVLTTAVSALGDALGADYGAIRLVGPEMIQSEEPRNLGVPPDPLQPVLKRSTIQTGLLRLPPTPIDEDGPA